MERPASELERRSKQYFYDDGITEIAAGGMFLAIALLFLAEALSPAGSFVTRFSSIVLVVLVAGGMWVLRPLVNYAKARITYPRTGYVRYRRAARSPQRRFGVAILAALISMGITFALMSTAPASENLVPTIQGLAFALFLAYMGYQVGVGRFYILAGVALVAGLGVTLSGMGEPMGSALFFGAMGASVVLSGAAALAGVPARHQPRRGRSKPWQAVSGIWPTWTG